MKIVITENQLTYLINEESLENFYIENNIDVDNLSYLGRGDFGEAFSIGDGRVLKKTRSKSEFELASKMVNDNSPYLESLVKVYKTEIVNGDMFIIMEELSEDSDIENLYYELDDMLSSQGLPIQYINNLDTDEFELSDDMIKFMDDIDDINQGYRYLGVEASDIKPDNLGYDSDGKLKAFDIDDKQRNR